MFARDHTAAGAMIALVSHFVLDLIGEHDFGSPANAMLEVIFLSAIGAILFAAGIHGHALAVIGATIFAANLPDITDKRAYLTFINPARWPMRRRWWCHQPGWPLIFAWGGRLNVERRHRKPRCRRRVRGIFGYLHRRSIKLA
jgi:hypothetical protein